MADLDMTAHQTSDGVHAVMAGRADGLVEIDKTKHAYWISKNALKAHAFVIKISEAGFHNIRPPLARRQRVLPNRNLTRIDLFALGELDCQDAFFERGFDFFGVHGSRQGDLAAKTAIPAFGVMEILAFGFLAFLLFAGNDQCVALHRNVHILRFHAGQFQRNIMFARVPGR